MERYSGVHELVASRCSCKFFSVSSFSSKRRCVVTSSLRMPPQFDSRDRLLLYMLQIETLIPVTLIQLVHPTSLFCNHDFLFCKYKFVSYYSDNPAISFTYFTGSDIKVDKNKISTNESIWISWYLVTFVHFSWQAIGNHEFDDGPEGLAPYLSHLKAPVLAANMNVSQVPELQGLFQDSIIVKRKGRKIGIIGLATQETAVWLVLVSEEVVIFIYTDHQDNFGVWIITMGKTNWWNQLVFWIIRNQDIVSRVS